MHDKPPTSVLVPLEFTPSVFLVAESATDGVRGQIGGKCAVLATILRQASDLHPGWLKKEEPGLFPVGQDIYLATWEFIMSIRGSFSFLSEAEIKSLPSTLPNSLRYYFVVTK